MVTSVVSADGTPPPLRVLCALANPVDMPRFDDARVWREITEALQPFSARGVLLFERLAEPTENALKRSFSQSTWHVLHLVAHATERSAARYGTIALQSSDQHARNLTANSFAAMLAGFPSLKLVVLQACDEASSCLDIVSEALLEHGVPVVATAPPLSGRLEQIFLSKLYAGVLAGLSADAMSKELMAALAADGMKMRALRVLSRDPKQPILALEPAAHVSPIPAPASPQSQEQSQADHSPWHQELERKRASGEFDVFLCHNSADKPAVKRIGQQLRETGILPWLDAWELPPGQPWQPLLEQQIGNIHSAAVFVGSAGIGPWQEQEMYGFLREFVKRKAPVIPVLLPDAPSTPDLPIFLRAMTWVDFRADDPNPLESLIWGITGRRPKD